MSRFRLSSAQQLSGLLFAAAAAWPSLLCALTNALQSPAQRAMAAAWCGQGAAELTFLGHCPACWAGAAALAGAGALVLAARKAAPARA